MGLLDRFKYTTYQETYLAGFSDFKGPRTVLIMFKEGFIEIETLGVINRKKISLHPENIIEISMNQNSYRHAGKAATGAIIGGFLSGGVGLIAGAAIGGKRRTENKLVLTINIATRNFDVFIEPSKTTTKLYSEFINFLSKYDKPHDQIPQNNQIENSAETTNFNIAEQIEKLHLLMEKGILTSEEFEAQKKKLLS